MIEEIMNLSGTIISISVLIGILVEIKNGNNKIQQEILKGNKIVSDKINEIFTFYLREKNELQERIDKLSIFLEMFSRCNK